MLLAWLLSALACNLPIVRKEDPNVQRYVQQTLSARLFGPGQTGTPRAVALPVVTITTTPPVESNEPLPIFTPLATETPPAQPSGPLPIYGYIDYTTQPGDTLDGLAGRFNLTEGDIPNPANLRPDAFLPMGQAFRLPDRVGDIRFEGRLIPDSEVVYSPTTVGFSTADFIRQANGFLATYSEDVNGKNMTGAQIVERVASETSTNPRLLLGVLEYRSHWVFGQPANPANTSHPIGFTTIEISGLYPELSLVARFLTIGYYGWRSGQFNQLEFGDNSQARVDPSVNAGTAALQNLFTKLYLPDYLQSVLYGPDGFLKQYAGWFGDPWARDQAMGPLLPDGLQQPPLELPFTSGELWALTGGPHEAWGIGSPWASLDFAPVDEAKGCFTSGFWATAVAPGVITRSENGIVILDLDGDGNEQTGWAIMYLHMATQDRIAVGNQVNTGDHIGHPSCEGGVATGKHEHLARKFNGEWMAADGPVPFVLSGWQAFAGKTAYTGSLVKGDQVVNSKLDDAAHADISH